MAKQWGVPPWEIAGESQGVWMLRWQAFQAQVIERDRIAQQQHQWDGYTSGRVPNQRQWGPEWS
jgi:hypothetical protein